MRYDLRYLGHSGVEQGPYRTSVKFVPNLSRERVWFDGELRDPVRFREAISALHDVVVGDLRFAKKDKTAYLAWKADEEKRARELRETLLDCEKARLLEAQAKEPIPPNLEKDFRRLHRQYWDARVRWANELSRHDPELFRSLVPCDPVVSVADDVVYFECFSKDESSYASLFVDRGSFSGAQEAALGTTNVDYSLALYDHFQGLRSYRPTRLSVDPAGFDVKVESMPEYREEKIDLPNSWLRGFGQISAASSVIGVAERRGAHLAIELDVPAVYSLLAYLKRHREKSGPRSLRFELRRGKPAAIVIEPFGERVQSRGRTFDGPEDVDIKVWGRRRLAVLARLLPLVERFEVHLLGSGMPSVWIAHMGDMRLVLALSGWTTNTLTTGTNLDLLLGEVTPAEAVMESVHTHLRSQRAGSLDEIAAATAQPEKAVASALHRLSQRGQVVYDFAVRKYRFRQVVEAHEGEAMMGPESPELTAARKLYVSNAVKIEKTEALPRNKRYVSAKISGETTEAVFDPDGQYGKAKCTCTLHRHYGTRRGPCRHLIALRWCVSDGAEIRIASGSIGGSLFSWLFA